MPVPKLAFGPISKNPSWRWVGFDIARELCKSFTIEFFRSYQSLPRADLMVCIKEIPPPSFIEHVLDQKSRIVYAPIDIFRLPEEICQYSSILAECDLLLVHSERLIPYLRPFAPVAYVDHHSKFALPIMADYKKDGYILWVGHICDFPWLLAALRHAPLNHEMRLLTRLKNPRTLDSAHSLAQELQVEMTIRENSVGPYEAYEWSERKQFEMMNECKAAIDVKGGPTNFNQFTKPATKIQKYVTAGIPCATNAESYSAQYFSRAGLKIAVPTDHERWFSNAYWSETHAMGKLLSEHLTVEAIGAKYRNLISMVIDGRPIGHNYERNDIFSDKLR